MSEARVLGPAILSSEENLPMEDNSSLAMEMVKSIAEVQLLKAFAITKHGLTQKVQEFICLV